MRTRETFMDAFKKIVAEKPIDKVTVAELVRETGLSRQAFYNHFLDKYDLSIQIYEQSFAPVAQGHRDRVTTWLESGIQHLEIYAADKDYYRNVLSSYDRSSLRFYLKDRMYHEFRHKCELRGAVFDTEDKVYALKMVVFATNEMTFEWVENGCLEPAEVIVKRFDLCRPMILSPYLEDTDSAANPCTDAPPPTLKTVVTSFPAGHHHRRGLVVNAQGALCCHAARKHRTTNAHTTGTHPLH